MGASLDKLPRGFGGSDVASVPAPKLVSDDDLNELLFRPTRDSDPCHRTTVLATYGTS